jgi:gluconolactonase
MILSLSAIEQKLTSCSWNPEGVLIGRFAVSGGSNNFAFVPGGIYIFNANKAFKVTIKAEGRTVRRDFGLGGKSRYT